MVVDELFVKKGTEFLPIDSIDNQMIDEIVYEGETLHFAKQKDLTGTSEIVADNGVQEPIISLEVSGATSQSLLPTEYQQVEYIESTGTQYIDTGFAPNQDTKVEIYGKQVSSTYNSIFGVNPLFVITSAGGKYTFRYNSTTFTTSVSSLELASLILDKNNAYLNGELVKAFGTGSFQATHNACLFARSNASGAVEEIGKSQIYYTKIWDNGNLVRHYIPCYRKSDNVVGMYDLVSGTLFTNSGTGTFSKGADYNQTPTPEVPVPIENANDNGIKITLGERTIKVPASVEVGGTTVELNMGKVGDYADSIVVDKLANKVSYIQNTNRIVFTGNEAWVFHGVQPEYDIPNVWYRIDVSPAGNINASQPAWLKTGLGYSNLMQFSFAEAAPNKEAWGFRFAYNNGARLYVFTPPDAGLDTLAKFKSFLQEKYVQGTPLIIEYACVTETHDITNTDLGQSLLALATGKGTNYLEIKSNLAPSKTDLSYWRQIIPGE